VVHPTKVEAEVGLDRRRTVQLVGVEVATVPRERKQKTICTAVGIVM